MTTATARKPREEQRRKHPGMPIRIPALITQPAAGMIRVKDAGGRDTWAPPGDPLLYGGTLYANATRRGEMQRATEARAAREAAGETGNTPAPKTVPPKPKVTPHRIHEVPGRTTPVKGPAPKAIIAPASPPQMAQDGHEAVPAPVGKGETVIHLLQRPAGATNAEMCEATGWQAHTVRGFLGGALKKKGILTESAVEEGRGRVYRAVVEEAV